MPQLLQLQKDSPKDVVAVTFCVDQSDTAETVVDDLKSLALDELTTRQMTTVNFISKTGVEDVIEHYKSGTVPCVMVVGKDGKLVKLFDEEFTYAGDVVPLVNQLLGK